MKGLWRIAIVVAAVLALGGAAVGFVTAQTDDGSATAQAERSNFAARLAENLGITLEEFQAAVQQTQLEIVDEKLANGEITEEQAAQIRERIESGEGRFGPGHGRPGHGFSNGFAFGRGFGHLGAASDALADFLGISVDDLRAARADDQSLAQIAESNSVGRNDLIAFLVGQVEDTLAAKVDEGKLDQARADELLERFREQVDTLIDSAGGHGFGGPWRHRQKDDTTAPTGVTI